MQFLDIHGLRELWKAILRENGKNKTVVNGMTSGSGARVTSTPVTVTETIQGSSVEHTEYNLNLVNTAAQSELEKIYGGTIPDASSADLKTITDLASQIQSVSVSSTDNTVTVTNGRDLSVNIDGNTLIKAVDTGIISSGLRLVKTVPTDQLGQNNGVKERFTLVDANGDQIGDQITVYYESSFKGARLGKGDPNNTGTDEDCLILSYIDVNGEDVDVYVPLGDFLRESEFGNGLQVVGGVVSVKIANGSESFLTIDGTNGLKLSGIQNAINTSKSQIIGASSDANDGTAETIHGVYNYVDDQLSGKVDKVSGKGLSTNDYTTAEKNKLAGIAAGAQENLVNDVQLNSTSIVNSNKIANLTITEGQTDGTIRVNGTDIAVHGLGSAAYADTTAFDASGAAASAETNAKNYTDDREAAIRGTGAGADTETLTSLRSSIDALGGSSGSIATQINNAIDDLDVATETKSATGTAANSGVFVVTGVTLGEDNGKIKDFAVQSIEVERAGTTAQAISDLRDGYTGTLDDLNTRIDGIVGSGSGSIQDRINASINGLDSSILADNVIDTNKTANNVEIEPETYVLTGISIENGLIVNTTDSNTKSIRVMGIPDSVLNGIFGEPTNNG